MARISEKYNDACLKIFALLKLFSEGEVEYSDVIELFRDSKGEITQKSNVTLNKFLNTVKIFGVEVDKIKHRYILRHMPFSIKLTEDDLQAVALMKSATNFLPDGKNKNNVLKLINNLQNLYDKDTKKLNVIIDTNKNYDLSFYFKKFETQIAECEEYLQNSCKLELIYTSEGKDKIMFCIPQEIKYLDKIVCYSVYNTLSRQIVDVPIDTIKNIRKVSDNASKEHLCTTVIFKLKGSLADRYRLRDWEHSEGKDENGWLTVINSGEDFNSLCTRLLRYDDKCVVVSPDSFKQHMLSLIDEMLELY